MQKTTKHLTSIYFSFQAYKITLAGLQREVNNSLTLEVPHLYIPEVKNSTQERTYIKVLHMQITAI